jgi:glycyl-tRNA synthetase
MGKIVALCKRRGFIYPSSEIYGGINGFWDYGPLGAELKRNLRDAWWRAMVHERTDVAGLDASIIMHPKIWEASGHVESFQDPLVDCKKCKGRWRADQLPETKCPQGGPHDYTEARPFNLMFKTSVGPVEESASISYLRPETAQAIFVQFLNVLNTTRLKVPFGIAQIGKAFRNEINPRNFTFRSREFEQMELEFFVKPDAFVREGERTVAQWHEYWVEERFRWYESIGLPRAKLHPRVYEKKELAHYASACTDIEFDFPFGRQELEGIAARGDFDLSQHQKFSGQKMEYFDEEAKARYIPHVIEPSAGLDRTVLALLCHAYDEETVTDEKGQSETRVVMRFAPRIAPIKVAVFPLLKNKEVLVTKAQAVFRLLQKHFVCQWDDRGNIGKRYRYQDEQGTPWCVTIDFETLEGAKADAPEFGVKAGDKETVTVRDRDSMKQVRVRISELVTEISKRF